MKYTQLATAAAIIIAQAFTTNLLSASTTRSGVVVNNTTSAIIRIQQEGLQTGDITVDPYSTTINTYSQSPIIIKAVKYAEGGKEQLCQITEYEKSLPTEKSLPIVLEKKNNGKFPVMLMQVRTTEYGKCVARTAIVSNEEVDL